MWTSKQSNETSPSGLALSRPKQTSPSPFLMVGNSEDKKGHNGERTSEEIKNQIKFWMLKPFSLSHSKILKNIRCSNSKTQKKQDEKKLSLLIQERWK